MACDRSGEARPNSNICLLVPVCSWSTPNGIWFDVKKYLRNYDLTSYCTPESLHWTCGQGRSRPRPSTSVGVTVQHQCSVFPLSFFWYVRMWWFQSHLEDRFQEVLLGGSNCAPFSEAVLEWMLDNKMKCNSGKIEVLLVNTLSIFSHCGCTLEETNL